LENNGTTDFTEVLISLKWMKVQAGVLSALTFLRTIDEIYVTDPQRFSVISASASSALQRNQRFSLISGSVVL
jgi:hypothetical protein